MEWTKEQLDLLEQWHKEELEEAEEAISESSYPPDEQRKIDINEAIIRLLRDMKNEKSWIYRKCHPQISPAEGL